MTRQKCIFAEVILALLCLCVQAGVLWCLRTSRGNDVNIDKNQEVIAIDRHSGQNAEPPSVDRRKALGHAPRRLERQLAGHRQLLDHLLTKEEFLEWSAKDLAVVEAYRQSGNASWGGHSTSTIDLEKEDWQKRLNHALEMRQKQFDEANHTLDVLAREDYSSLDDEDFENFAEYFEATSQWVNCMYDDQVPAEERAAALRRFYEARQAYSRNLWSASAEGKNPLVENFRRHYGDASIRYQQLRSVMDLTDLENYGSIRQANVYRFSKYDEEQKTNRVYQVPLFED